MKLQLKALTLTLLAAVALGAIVSQNAGANGDGHFVTDETHADIWGFSNENHSLDFSVHGLTGELGCETIDYVGTMISATKTTSELNLTPTFKNCITTGNLTLIPVHATGCTFKFTVAKGTTDNTEQTAHILCSAGGAIEITHPSCTVVIPPQAIKTGLTYTRKSESGFHFITVDVNIQVNATVHGLCQFVMPTNATGTFKGWLRIRAFKPKSINLLNLTAT